MNWFAAAFAAQFILGSSAVFDKLLLKKSYPNPLGYTFWLALIGLAAIALIPFGFHVAPLYFTILALVAGAVFTFAILFLYLALFRGDASSTLPLIAALSPVATLLLGIPLLNVQLNTVEYAAFALLIAGGLILFTTEPKRFRFAILGFALTSVFCFGLTNILTKIVFLQTNFVTGFVLIKIGAAVAAFAFLAFPSLRKKILRPEGRDEFHNRTGYLLNRAWAGMGSILLSFAIFLGSPPLVDATKNLQFVFIFFGGWLLLKERFRGLALFGKILALIVISLGILTLGTYDYLHMNLPDPNRPITWGITFSQEFSAMMGLDWKENYNAVLTDLNVKHLRLIAYWDEIEKEKGRFDFADLDYQMDAAKKNGADVILAVGQRVPRWPECHFPDWTANLAVAERNQDLREFLAAVANHYKNNSVIRYWQIENEPFLAFGECPKVDPQFLDSEIQTVKSLDPAHPTLVTDSGELSLWYQAASRGDVFGTTMYRRTYSSRFGALDYHLPPEFFILKEKFARWLTKDYSKRYIVIELGAEPWLLHQLYETTVHDQLKVFDLPYFKDTISYAKAAGFDEYYLWGAEWWYWMKTKQNDGAFWDYAQSVVRSH